MNNFEEDKTWGANEETRRRERVGNQLSTLEEEEIENDFGTVISRDSEMVGSGITSGAPVNPYWRKCVGE